MKASKNPCWWKPFLAGSAVIFTSPCKTLARAGRKIPAICQTKSNRPLIRSARNSVGRRIRFGRISAWRTTCPFPKPTASTRKMRTPQSCWNRRQKLSGALAAARRRLPLAIVAPSRCRECLRRFCPAWRSRWFPSSPNFQFSLGTRSCSPLCFQSSPAKPRSQATAKQKPPSIPPDGLYLSTKQSQTNDYSCRLAACPNSLSIFSCASCANASARDD